MTPIPKTDYIHSSPSSPRGSIANIHKNKPSQFNMSLANKFLDILTDCISLNGPEIYLSSYIKDEIDQKEQQQESTKYDTNITGLYPMVHIKSRLHKGWSFTAWMRLARDQKAGRYNILSFEGLLRISIECKIIPQITNC